MTNLNLVNAGSNVDTNKYFNCDLHPLGTIDNFFSSEIIDEYATKDANYILKLGQEDDNLSGEIYINNQIESAFNIACNTLDKIGADCVEKAQDIFNSHNTDNFKDKIETEYNKLHTKIKHKLTGQISQYQQKKSELLECKNNLKNYQQKNGLENKEPLDFSTSKKIRTWSCIILIIWIEAAANAFLFKSDRGSMLDQSMIAVLLSILNSVFGFFLAKSYIGLTVSKRKFFLFFPFALCVTLILSLNFATAHYRNVALTVSDFSEMDTATITSFIENPLHIVGFKTWILLFLGISCSYFSSVGYFKLTDKYPEFTQIYNHVKNLEQEIQDLMNNYKNIISDLEKEGFEVFFTLYSEANTSLKNSINQLIVRYYRYYNDLPRLETYLENLSSQVLQDYKFSLLTKLKEKECSYTKKNKNKIKLAKKTIYDYSIDLKQTQSLQNEKYNQSEIEKIYKEYQEKLSNLSYSLLTPLEQGEQS